MLEPRYVDTREQSRIAPLVRAGFKSRHLDCADVTFPEAGGDTVGIEHKTVGLLVADMMTGQLTRQCRQVVETYRYPVLMVEGHWARDPKTGELVGREGRRCTWEALWNELQSLQDTGLRLQLTTSPEHTITRILELAEYYGKGWHPSVQRQVAGDARIAVLSLITGMGTKRSQTLLDTFLSLAAIANASLEDIMAVDGFGPIQAKRIYEFWKHRAHPVGKSDFAFSPQCEVKGLHEEVSIAGSESNNA